MITKATYTEFLTSSYPGSIFFAGALAPTQAMIVAFTDQCRQAGHPVESICQVLTEQGCQVPHGPIGPGPAPPARRSPHRQRRDRDGQGSQPGLDRGR